jgi:hypothetical protein
LVQLDDDLQSLLRPVPPGPLADLVQLCEELGFATTVASFNPVELPAVLTYHANAERVRDAAAGLDEGLYPDGFAHLMRGYVEQQRAASSEAGTLHLNAACPLLHFLASTELPPGRRQAALAVVPYFARLFCGRMLNADEATADIRAWQRSLEQLVS